MELDADSMRFATPMRDVGEIGIDPSILLKRGKLTITERREMQRHAEIGRDILSGFRRPTPGPGRHDRVDSSRTA